MVGAPVVASPPAVVVPALSLSLPHAARRAPPRIVTPPIWSAAPAAHAEDEVLPLIGAERVGTVEDPREQLAQPGERLLVLDL